MDVQGHGIGDAPLLLPLPRPLQPRFVKSSSSLAYKMTDGKPYHDEA